MRERVMKCTRMVDGMRFNVHLNGKLLKEIVFSIFKMTYYC